MANSFEVKISGDMTAGLEKMLGPDAEAILRAGGFAAAAVYRDEAVRLVPVDTATIQRNIIVKRIEEKSDGGTKQMYYVTVRKGKMNVEGDAFYWRFVEFGHSFVRRKTKKSTTWKAHRAAMQVEYGSSSAPAKPFMRPAYDTKQKEAGEAGLAAMAEKFSILRGVK
jgi:HK97 gp10 family phage protein